MFGSLPTSVLFIVVVLYARETMAQSSHVEVHVKCTEDTFRCSDSKCIQKHQVCDGTTDCTNGQDEYCVTDFTTFTTPSLPVCFMCNNGQCIQPILSADDEYDLESGMKRDELWWLCDDYDHCEDGTDEIDGACGDFFPLSNVFFSCVPSLISTNNVSVNILQTKVCDGTKDCLHGEDEPHCDVVKSSQNTDSSTDGMGPGMIALICVAVGVVVLCICAGVCCSINRAKIPDWRQRFCACKCLDSYKKLNIAVPKNVPQMQMNDL